MKSKLMNLRIKSYLKSAEEIYSQEILQYAFYLFTFVFCLNRVGSE
jgi:hypothetical protein